MHSPLMREEPTLLAEARGHCRLHGCDAAAVIETGDRPGVVLSPRGGHEPSLRQTTDASCRGRFLVVTLASRLLPQATLLLRSTAEHRYTVIVLPMAFGETFMAKVRRLEQFAAVQCPNSVLLLTDAYDSFVAAPATLALDHFLQLRTRVLFSAELLFSWQEAKDQAFFDAMADGRGPYRYLNTGGIMGYAHALRPLLNRTVMPAHTTVRAVRSGLCCPFAKDCWCHYLGADQIAFSRILTDHWADFNVTLDYDSRVFYVASGQDWKLPAAREHMLSAEPCVVHVPGVSERYKHRDYANVMKRNATLQGLFREFAAPRPTARCELRVGPGRRCPGRSQLKPGEWFVAHVAALSTSPARALRSDCQQRLRAWEQSCGRAPSVPRLEMRIRTSLHGARWTALR